MAPGVRAARRLDLESLGFERTPGPQGAGQGGLRGALEIGEDLRAPGGAFSAREPGADAVGNLIGLPRGGLAFRNRGQQGAVGAAFPLPMPLLTTTRAGLQIRGRGRRRRVGSQAGPAHAPVAGEITLGEAMADSFGLDLRSEEGRDVGSDHGDIVYFIQDRPSGTV